MNMIRRKQGFTLIEVLVSMGIIAIGILALASARTKSINYTSVARSYVTATNLASAKVDQCAAIPRYLMMFCRLDAPNACTAGQNPMVASCCPGDPATLGVCGACAGTEMHVECAPDGTPDKTYNPHEAGYYNFRRRTVVSAKTKLPNGDDVDMTPMVQVTVDVCFPRPGKEGMADAGDPDKCDYWNTSPCSICVKESLLRTTD